jgi:hypothetical protein
MRKDEYKYVCFAPYITKESYKNQRRIAVAQTISYLKKAIAIRPANKHNNELRRELKDLKSGNFDDGWHWCAD